MKKLFACICVLVAAASPAFSIDLSSEIDTATARLMPKVIEWRRHLHQYPELGNREVKRRSSSQARLGSAHGHR